MEYARVCLAMWALLTAVRGGAAAVLPDEHGQRAALGCEPFPSRLHAFVWRNWSVVPQQRLTEVVGATTGEVARIAASLGLPPQRRPEPEWGRGGYITVVRRNWHLLPYDQLLTLLGFSRERLCDALMEDDFLYVKLGNLKPACEPLRYAPPTAAEEAGALRLSGWLSEEGVASQLVGLEEPRFQFVRDLERPDPALGGPRSAASPFSLRFVFSYFADYGDPLLDPDVRSYPEGLLQRLAAAGVNGVWVHTVLRTLAPDPRFPEFGHDAEKRLAGLRTLVSRAKRYGIDVYLYMNEPRAMPEAFFDSDARTPMRGVREGGRRALCTSCPEVRRWLSDALARVFTEVPGLGGVFTITASENLTNCASHRHQAECERCKERPYAEIIAEVNSCIADGVARGNPSAKTIVWDWGWDDEQAEAIIARLPQRCWFMSVSEWSLPITRGGVTSKVGEYALSAVGPGPRAARHWGWARKAGLKTCAKVQTSASWELSAFPYVPVMDLVAEHARNLSSAGVDGLMLSWSLGGYPAPNLDVFQELTVRGESQDAVLDRVAARRYGRGAGAARLAWAAFSAGFREYPYHVGTLYHGPQHMGPANPLFLRPTGFSATMVGLPYDDLKSWRAVYPADVWIGQMARVRDGFREGCERFSAAVGAAEGKARVEAEREAGLFRAAELHFASCVEQARFVQARDAYRTASDPAARAASLEAMRTAARAELLTAKRLLPLARADARIGFESSNQYFYVPQDLAEKVLNCRWVLSELDGLGAND